MASFKNSRSAEDRDDSVQHSEDAHNDGVHQDTEQRSEADTVTLLAKTIEGEIIPRLLLAHKVKTANGPPIAAVPAPNKQFSESEVETFAKLSYALASSKCFAALDEARAKEVPLESIILDLLAPAAEHLGEMWKVDQCTFTEVTVGLSRLRQMLRDISPDFEDEKASWKHGRRALLLPTPGEQHTFGLFIVEAFFRREGWDVWAGPADSLEEVRELAGSQWYAVAGFSLHSEQFLPVLAPAIRAVREGSLNPEIGVLVGGQAFLDNPSLVAEVGADGGATDGKQAVIEARNVLGRIARP